MEDRCIRHAGKNGRTGYQIFIAMGLEDMGDFQAFGARYLQINIAVSSGVNDGSLSS